MNSKLNKIEAMAVRIACAELVNGHRSFWLYDMTDAKMEALASASVSLAEKLAKHAAKHEPPGAQP